MKISQIYPLQLEIEFSYCDEESDLLKRADDIIQKEFDEKQGGEHIGIIGYHYWLFLDAIARIDVPDGILEKYANKYA